MRALYVPMSDNAWAQYYAAQASQAGAGFQGQQFQRGAGLGSIFRGIFRALLPIAKSAGKVVGRQALKTGALIANDVVSGTSIKAAAKRRGRQGAARILKRASRKLQTGKGLGRRPRKRRTPARKRTAKRTTIKRKKRKAPATKRRRGKKRKVSDQLGFYYQ